MAKPKATAKRRKIRARVRGRSLDLIDSIALPEGAEIVVTISEPIELLDKDALFRAAGATKVIW